MNFWSAQDASWIPVLASWFMFMTLYLCTLGRKDVLFYIEIKYESRYLQRPAGKACLVTHPGFHVKLHQRKSHLNGQIKFSILLGNIAWPHFSMSYLFGFQRCVWNWKIFWIETSATGEVIQYQENLRTMLTIRLYIYHTYTYDIIWRYV